jgi:WD40 repeat protein
MDADGGSQKLIATIRGMNTPAWSPDYANASPVAWSRDGTRLLVASQEDGDSEIYTLDIAGAGLKNLSRSKGSDNSPSWSPDGKRIAFVSDRGGSSEIWVMDADGRNASSVTSPLQFCDIYYEQKQGQLRPVLAFYPEYYRSLIVRLYNFDGREVVPQEATVISYKEMPGPGGKTYKVINSAQSFKNYGEAVANVTSRKSEKVKIIGTNPFISPVPLGPLQNYKLVYSSKDTKTVGEGRKVPEVKVFEYSGAEAAR